MTAALLNNRLHVRPDDYQYRLPDTLRAIDAPKIDTAARQYLAPDQLAIIVVGDCKPIDEQLAGLGMEIEYVSAEEL